MEPTSPATSPCLCKSPRKINATPATPASKNSAREAPGTALPILALRVAPTVQIGSFGHVNVMSLSPAFVYVYLTVSSLVIDISSERWYVCEVL